MKNLTIKRVVQVKLYLTAEQWGLYNPKSVEAAGTAWALNNNIENYVNRGEDRKTVALFTRSMMVHAREFGADDTEPHDILEQILDEIYRDEA